MVDTELHIAKLLKPTSNYIPCGIKENDQVVNVYLEL